MAYDYLMAMKDDVREWIEWNEWFTEHELDDAEDELYEALWAEDSVTGNGSGSYTFDRNKAKEYVLDNVSLCKEALEEFCTEPGNIADHFLDEDWEWFDVTIRCYMLSRAISDVMEEIRDEV